MVVLDRIGDQVGEHLPQARAIGDHGRQVVRYVDGETPLSVEVIDDLLHQCARVDLFRRMVGPGGGGIPMDAVD